MTEAPSIKEALEAIEPYLDAITCYASSVDEHEGNRVAKMVRTALATFQPDGERREAIARIIDPEAFEDDRPTWHDRRVRALNQADLILASGFVQNEAGWRTMDSAPRDGTRILWSCGDDKMSVIHWPEYDLCFEGGYWKPLPAPPIRSARDGGEG